MTKRRRLPLHVQQIVEDARADVAAMQRFLIELEHEVHSLKGQLLVAKTEARAERVAHGLTRIERSRTEGERA